MTPSRPRVRWAVVGTGRICETFVPDLQTVDPASVVSVWGRRPEIVADFAARHGIPQHSVVLDEVLSRDDVDAVYVATPVATHAQLAIRALEAGKHVLVEKPMAFSAAEAEEIFERARANDRFAMEAMWMKFNPLHVEIARLIGEGLIGEPRYVRGAFGMPFPAGGTRWNAELGGSTVLDQGIYPVTLAEWVLGPVQSITATGRVLDGVDVTADISLQHDDGRMSHAVCSLMEFTDPSASLSGTAGWIEIPAMFWATDVARIHAGSTGALFGTPDELSRPREGNGYVPMIRSVVDAIADELRQHPQHDRTATLRTATTLDAVREQIHAHGTPETRYPATKWTTA
ncbi:Gfo/Idh/MocA family protein [Herbiconiux ginsengi]|uniref:Predicted dehydrogenase n=1 Tax=Herbiconiux ginsengi TaxID=381665 RepID=A0A1H3LQR6_9MICO|nr:Gfo/Idh/MocA family oxidoreductase [Herbiconiux ginsengi]SDY66439.1 Predicted dehydrogenase [Herbiconiux ginsengi]